MTSRGMNMQLFSGKPFWLADPKIVDVDINDISQSLSKICRFNGHCTAFYSVAEHSVNVAKVLQQQGKNQEIQLQGLLHDAHEAYIGDIPTPMKRSLSNLSVFEVMEKRVWAVVAERFGLPDNLDSSVGEADLIMLATEKDNIMNMPNGTIWGPLPEPVDMIIQCHSPDIAHDIFMEEFTRLTTK